MQAEVPVGFEMGSLILLCTEHCVRRRGRFQKDSVLKQVTVCLVQDRGAPITEVGASTLLLLRVTQ